LAIWLKINIWTLPGNYIPSRLDDLFKNYLTPGFKKQLTMAGLKDDPTQNVTGCLKSASCRTMLEMGVVVIRIVTIVYTHNQSSTSDYDEWPYFYLGDLLSSFINKITMTDPTTHFEEQYLLGVIN
jgi:hypothetical protein